MIAIVFGSSSDRLCCGSFDKIRRSIERLLGSQFVAWVLIRDPSHETMVITSAKMLTRFYFCECGRTVFFFYLQPQKDHNLEYELPNSW